MQETLLATRSAKPYLIRAIRDWAHDTGCSPHILVDTAFEGVAVPQSYIHNERIILNTHDRAVKDFLLDNKRISFSTRFNGVVFKVAIPIGAIIAIFSKESGIGLSFGSERQASEPGHRSSQSEASPQGRSHIKLVK